MTKKRIDYLDLAKGIGIILVVAGHSTFMEENLLTWISSFHMPLFFILSGILIRLRGEEVKSFRQLITNKVRTIAIPYLCFSIIYIAIDSAYLILKQDNITIVDLQRSAIETVTLYGISVLWFLPALFFAETAFLFTRKKTNHRATIAITVIVAALTAFAIPLFKDNYPMFKSMPVLWIGYLTTSILRGAIGFVFISIGYFAATFLKEKNKISLKELVLGILFMLLSIAVGLVNKRVDLHTLVLNNAIYFYIAAISGAAAVILICRNIKPFRILKYLGENSLIIMATHLDCQVMIMSINLSYFMNQYVTRAKQYVFYLCLAIFVIIFEVIIIIVINRYFPFLIGKKKRKDRAHLRVYK